MHFGELVFSRLREIDISSIGVDDFEAAYRRLSNLLSSNSVHSLDIPSECGEREARVFIAERMIIAHTKSDYILRRVAIAYSKAMANSLSTKQLEEVSRLLGIEFKKEGDAYKIHVASYLMNSPDSSDYNLFYVKLSKGWVELSPKKFLRLVEEAIKKRLEVMPKSDSEIAKSYAAQLKELLPKPKVKFVGEKPPCIEDILKRMAAHENLGHYARWVLGVFLIKTGMDMEQIVKLYSTLPDFSEDITRYQLNHIKEKGYSVPSCDKMEVYGLRKKECPCLSDNRIKSPLMAAARKRKGDGKPPKE